MAPSQFIAAHRRTRVAGWRFDGKVGWLDYLGKHIANRVKMLALPARTPWTAMKSNGWRRSRYQAFAKPSVVLLFQHLLHPCRYFSDFSLVFVGQTICRDFWVPWFQRKHIHSVSVEAAHRKRRRWDTFFRKRGRFTGTPQLFIGLLGHLIRLLGRMIFSTQKTRR